MEISENKLSGMKILGKVMNISKALDTNYLIEWLYQFIFPLPSVSFHFTYPYQAHMLSFFKMVEI
jgi:hypothetical protein